MPRHPFYQIRTYTSFGFPKLIWSPFEVWSDTVYLNGSRPHLTLLLYNVNKQQQ